MVNLILSDVSASISELKKNPMATVSNALGFPIAILNRNEPVFYCVPAKVYETIMEKIEDIELIKLIKEREKEDRIRVDIDDL